MPESPNNLVITTLAKGATAQLRELVEHADKDAALPIYRELKRLAAQLARKHDFTEKPSRPMTFDPNGPTAQKVRKEFDHRVRQILDK
jgi:hypothetical protein